VSDWLNLKQKARQWHKELLLKSASNPSAMALLIAATEITGINRIPLPAGDALLMGAEAIFDRAANLIFFDEDIDTGMTAFFQMHEFAHSQLHEGSWSCKRTDINPEASEEAIPLGIARVETYNPREQAEREANIFAREVLLPSDTLRSWFVEAGTKASEISARVGVPLRMVEYQISFSVLVSDLLPDAVGVVETGTPAPLDSSQKVVAEWIGGPLLIEAGPGTGKTKTLVGRIEFLLSQNTPPSSILALTFSNKAAGEIRSRVTNASKEVAHQIWMGTFHAFGLELLRKFGFKIGVNADFTVLDPIDSIFILEEKLQSLHLVHYRNLYEPSIYLPDILAAISRAKDELVDPTSYMAFAEKMMLSAGVDEKKRVTAEKAKEVAHVYQIYQQHLDAHSLLDFGDLISRSVRLLQDHQDVRDDIRKVFRHVLVDEYQDVNRASGVLLGEISPSGPGVWVVGDARQSVYRFRGAAPANMRRFDEDFPGATTRPLEVNYRSLPEIVRVFSTLAPKMKASLGRPFTPWRANRASGPGVVRMEIAGNLESEVAGIAAEIMQRHSAGCPFGEQAILCRSHTTMARIGAHLEEMNVPILYLGDLFERDEIRDLLSLLSLSYKGDGNGLVRVSQFPEYKVPLQDVITVMNFAKENNIPFPGAVEIAKNLTGISDMGRQGLAILASHLGGLAFTTTAWEMLVSYLFERSSYLTPLLLDRSLSAQQKRLAIYQFLEFAHDRQSFTFSKGRDPKRLFLDYIRKLEIHGGERQLRQVPDWASGIDAVRILSVHASKGLEFNTVFVPYLGRGYFPTRSRSKVCPPPEGMIHLEPNEGVHGEEEECLFFVALSRARDYLCLSRATRYGQTASNPSDLLDLISGVLPKSISGLPTWSAGIKTPVPSPLALPPEKPTFEVRDLDVYIQCPRRYYYEKIIGLRGRTEDTAYVSFHRCVYKVVQWIREERAEWRIIDHPGANAKLSDVWAQFGPRNHIYETFYWESAVAMVSLAASRAAKGRRMIPPPTWEVRMKAGSITVTPDFFEETEGFHTVIRFRTKRPTSDEQDKDIYAIYQTAVETATNGKGRVAIYYLSTGDTVEVNMSSKKIATRLGHYEDAMAGIRWGNFPHKHDDRNCPRCPFYFVCPSGDPPTSY